MSGLYLGVDVGTGSVRAAIFDGEGKRHGLGVAEIRTWREGADIVEQSSDDIWRAAGVAIRAALDLGAVDPKDIRGIGFDATCSRTRASVVTNAEPISPPMRRAVCSTAPKVSASWGRK